jgi:hypothetical protein
MYALSNYFGTLAEFSVKWAHAKSDAKDKKKV